MFTGSDVLVLAMLRAMRRHWRHCFFAYLLYSTKCFTESEKDVLRAPLLPQPGKEKEDGAVEQRYKDDVVELKFGLVVKYRSFPNGEREGEWGR